MARRFVQKKVKRNLLPIFFLPIILSMIGLFFVFEASSVRSFNDLGNSFHFLRLQATWLVLGIVAMSVFSVFDYRRLYMFSPLAIMTTIVLLFLVLIPGIGSSAGGARRWLDLGLFNLQPTEFAKFSVILYLSSWFVQKERTRFFSFLFLLGLLMGLIMLQPDMGTAIIVFFISIIIYFLAGVQIYHLFLLIPAAAAGFFFLIQTSAYRFNRFLTYLNPELDPLGIGYHVNQIMISLQAGGFLGRGLGASRQKYLFLPEAHTDSIFAIVGEEFGFLGSALILFLFFILVYKIYEVAATSSDRFGRLLAGGIMAYFCLQISINLGGIVGLLPLTGVPLPFFSYGGSNLLVSFALLGILLNIAKKS